MANPLRALIVEDSEADCALLLRILQKGGYEVAHERVDSAEALRARLNEEKWNIVISDFSMPGFNGSAALAIVRETDPDLPFIFLSGTIGEDTAVEAMRTAELRITFLRAPPRDLFRPFNGVWPKRRFAGHTKPRNNGCANWRNSRPLASSRGASPTISTM